MMMSRKFSELALDTNQHLTGADLGTSFLADLQSVHVAQLCVAVNFHLSTPCLTVVANLALVIWMNNAAQSAIYVRSSNPELP